MGELSRHGSDETSDEIHALGAVRYLVAPTPLHTWRLQQGRALFAQAQLWGPPKLRGHAHIAFTGLLGDDPPAAWGGDLDQLVFKGNAIIEEAAFFHKRSRTLIMTDFIQNYRTEDGAFLANLMKRTLGVIDGGVPLDIRLTFTNRRLARHSLEELLSWDFDSLVVAHGACVQSGAKALIRKAFRWLTK